MQRYVNFIASTTSTSSTLMVLSNATCTVYVAGTSTAATLYSDNGITPLANPFLSSSTGQVAFYAANGLYDLVVSKIGYLTVTISAIELDDLLAPSGSNSVGYLPAGTGAVATTVQTKLRESVSVKDFGAVGNGVADDTATVQAAMAATGDIQFLNGNFNIPSSISYSGSQILSVGQLGEVTGIGASLLGLTTGGLAKRQLLQLNTTGGDTATQYIRRIANHSGGTAEWVSAALNVRSDVNSASATNVEIAVLGALFNYADAGMNCGGYFQGNKYSIGPTWAATLEARDKTGSVNPTGALVGVEVDIFANGGDSNNTRVGVEITIGKNAVTDTKCEATYGARVTSVFGDSTQARVKRAFAVYNLEFDCGFDTSQGAQSATGVAFRMAAQQKLSFTATNDRYLTWNTGVFQYWSGGGSPSLEITDAGAMNIYQPFSIFGTQVVTSRRTGFTNAMSGTANQGTAYNTATITLVQLAERVKAIQDALTTHGLIGP